MMRGLAQSFVGGTGSSQQKQVEQQQKNYYQNQAQQQQVTPQAQQYVQDQWANANGQQQWAQANGQGQPGAQQQQQWNANTQYQQQQWAQQQQAQAGGMWPSNADPNNSHYVNPTQNPMFQQQQGSDAHSMAGSESETPSSSSSDVSRQSRQSQNSSLKVPGQPHNLHVSRYADYQIDQDLKTDPAPMLAPKSKKMALGSITFTSEQHREFGIYVKDNSFFLRCEKNDPIFCDRLNHNVAKTNGLQIPSGIQNAHDYWPADALNRYCNNRNANLQREMDKSYRRWHDGRCMMHELYQRVAALLRY